MRTAVLKKAHAPGHEQPLSTRERVFVTEYMVDMKGTAALQRLGWGGANPKQRAAEMLARPRVQAAIERELEKRAQAAEVTGERIRARLAEIAFAEPDGPITPSHQLEAMKQLSQLLGLTRPEATSVVVPVQFNIIGGPPLRQDNSGPDAPQDRSATVTINATPSHAPMLDKPEPK